METQEAIDTLKWRIKTASNLVGDNGAYDDMRMAITALEKQIPKKVIDVTKVTDKDIGFGRVGKCPCCNEIIDETSQWAVCDCGQKLEWN